MCGCCAGGIWLGAALPALAEGVIDEDECGHGFDDGYGSGEDAGVMASTAFEGGIAALGIDGGLLVHDRGDGFEGDAEVDGFAVGDAALDTAGAVGCGADSATLVAEGVVMFEAGEFDAIKAGAYFEAARGWQAEHGFGEVGFQPVEDWFTPARGDITCDAEDYAADGVACAAHFFDEPDHFLGCFGVGTADDIGFDILGAELVGIDGGGDFLDLLDGGQDFDSEEFLEQLFRDGTCGDPADGFARAGASAALPIPNAELGLVGIVGVGRAVFPGHFRIGIGAGVLVFDPHGYGGSEGAAFEGA